MIDQTECAENEHDWQIGSCEMAIDKEGPVLVRKIFCTKCPKMRYQTLNRGINPAKLSKEQFEHILKMPL